MFSPFITVQLPKIVRTRPVVVRLWTACGVSYIYFVQLEFSIYYLYTTALCNSGKVHFVPERLKASRDKFMSLALV